MSSQKIAVIGSGISGLGSAFILSGKHRVYLFEKEKIWWTFKYNNNK